MSEMGFLGINIVQDRQPDEVFLSPCRLGGDEHVRGSGRRYDADAVAVGDDLVGGFDGERRVGQPQRPDRGASDLGRTNRSMPDRFHRVVNYGNVALPKTLCNQLGQDITSPKRPKRLIAPSILHLVGCYGQSGFMRLSASLLALALACSASPAMAVPGPQSDTNPYDYPRLATAMWDVFGIKIEPAIRYGRTPVETLDVWLPFTPGPHPVVVLFHGGGWVEGKPEENAPLILPLVSQGWAVVNVRYRLARVAPAPAAVLDARCALRWTFANAKERGFDPKRVVVMGGSAGAHLALMAGLPAVGAFDDRACPVELPSGAPSQAAAIVDLFGPTDLVPALAGPGSSIVHQWFAGARGDPAELARKLSPLSYVRTGAPPVFIVHGTADTIVPYSQSVRLKEALDRAGVPNEMVSVDGAGHGTFDAPARLRFFGAMQRFLTQRGLWPAKSLIGNQP